jgi:hypothetical protein
MIFELLKYEVNPNDGCIAVEFRAFNSTKIHSAICPNATAANAVIQSNKNTALKLAMEKWLINKKKIIENGVDKNNLFKIGQLEKAMRLQEQISFSKSLTAACRTYIDKWEIYNQILPHPINKQHGPAIERLQEIISFCSEELNQMKSQAA